MVASLTFLKIVNAKIVASSQHNLGFQVELFRWLQLIVIYKSCMDDACNIITPSFFVTLT